MSAFDNLKNKAAELADQHQDKVESLSDAAIEKAGDAVDSSTGGKYADQVDAAQAKADEAIGDNQS